MVSGKPKAEVLRKIDDFRKTKNVNNDRIKNNKDFIAKNRFKTSSNPFLQDHLERPERKILLIHGQPGLGKTTLAHVVAETAGYSVIEINARYKTYYKLQAIEPTLYLVTKEWEIQ